MRVFSKVCDGADWFREGIAAIVAKELREPARFHRKQWEFAGIFQALRDLGVLRSDAVGLSMGGGRERILYSVAQHIGGLYVTDLYDSLTSWDCARTDDPEQYVKSDLPFPVDVSKISVLRADMREIPFPAGRFDFCYSTCAIEHIGGREDFLRHLGEVHRVLKDDGIYVFTTEFHFGPETIDDAENVIFSWDYLKDLLETSPLTPEPVFDAALTPHAVNRPCPSNIHHLLFDTQGNLSEELLGGQPHLILLRGRHPFTAALFVLRKQGKAQSGRITIHGLQESREFLDTEIGRYRDRLSRASVSINPFSSLPEGVPPHFLDHASFMGKQPSGDTTLFHTDYFWWGSGKRSFDITVKTPGGPVPLDLRIHSYRTLRSSEITCVLEENFSVTGKSTSQCVIEVDRDRVYAVLGKSTDSGATLDSVRVASHEANSGQSNSLEVSEVHERMESL